MNRSKTAQIYENIVRTVRIPKGRNLEDVLLKYRKLIGKKRYELPLLVKMTSKIDDVMGGDLRLFYMNTESDSDKLIVYLHGGAYVEELLPFHWLMLDKITKKVDSTFIIPDYPLAPYSDFNECFEKMTVFYQKVLKYYSDKKIIFMGDSAGGGLCLSLSLYFAQNNLVVPDQLILLSPWVDLSMDNPEITEYIDKDPLLKLDELKVDASYWANGNDLKDYRISPIYGDLSVLKDVNIFVGTHEILYPDITKLKRLLDEAKVKNNIYIGEGLNHVFPAFPIPEADEAIDTISKLITGV